MKTYMAKPAEVERKWFCLDGDGVALGRLAAEAARILHGKHKATFTPNVDCGDNLIIINSDKVILTGKKEEQKYFKRYTGYVGGLKEIQYKTMMAEKSDVAVLRAIKGMLPKNSLGIQMATRVHIYKGAEHKHEAQKPETIKLGGKN